MSELSSSGSYRLDLSRNEKPLRHEYNGTVSVIGAGTICSKLVLLMSSLVDISKVTVWDYDIVEQHNIANQVYGNWQVENEKVISLAEVLAVKLAPSREELLRLLGNPDYLRSRLPVSVKGMKFTPDDCLESNVVVVAPDNMTARNAVVNYGVVWGPDSQTDLIIEVRIGEAEESNIAEIFFLDPKNERHRDLWNQYYFSDDTAPAVNPCDKVTSDAWSTMVSAYVVKLFEKWLMYRQLKPYYHMAFGDDCVPRYHTKKIPADVVRPSKR